MEEVVTDADRRDEVDAAAIVSYYPTVKGGEKIALQCDIADAIRAARNDVPEIKRLEREVVEACRAELAVWEGFHTAGWTTRSASARNRIRKATRALIEFESNQIKK